MTYKTMSRFLSLLLVVGFVFDQSPVFAQSTLPQETSLTTPTISVTETTKTDTVNSPQSGPTVTDFLSSGPLSRSLASAATTSDTTVERYDNDGNLTRSTYTSYFPGGQMKKREDKKYKNGILTRHVLDEWSEDGSLTHRLQHDYNSDGSEKSYNESIYKNGILFRYHSYKFDKLGNMSTSRDKFYDNSGNLVLDMGTKAQFKGAGPDGVDALRMIKQYSDFQKLLDFIEEHLAAGDITVREISPSNGVQSQKEITVTATGQKYSFLVYFIDEAAIANQPSDSTLIGYWDFEDAGSAVIDKSGFDNNGVLSGGSLSESAFGQGLHLDGTGGVTVPNSISLNSLAGGFTMSAWINPDTTFDDYKTLFWKTDRDNIGTVPQLHFQVGDYGADTGRLYGAMNQSANDGGFEGNSSPSVILNKWQHVAWTYDEHDMRFYYNGVEVISFPVTDPWGGNDVDLLIGAHPVLSQANFTGMIDEARIYRGALTNAEIQALASLSQF